MFTAKADYIEELRTLNEIADTLNRALDVRSVLNTTLARLVELVGLETGWIFLGNPTAEDRWAGRGYTLAAHYNLPPALTLTNLAVWDKGCDCQRLCNEGKLNQAYNEVRCSRLANASGDRQGLVVHASTPLMSGERVLGILNVAASDWDAFSPRALELLTNAGRQMGNALERARLFELIQEQRVHEQASLLDLSNQLLGRLDLDDLMNYIVEEVRRLLQVDACALLLPDEETGNLYFRAASGWRSQPVANRYYVPADERSGSGRVLQTHQPLLMEDSDSHKPLPWMADWLKQEGFRSAAIVPLIVDDRAVGTLVIDTRQSRHFNEAEIRFLQLMANQVAIALEKARLHQEEIQRHRMEQELTVGRQIQLSMLPKRCPVVAGWQLAAAYEAARQVGGDFYDFFKLPEASNQLGLIIADVSDKGVPAALFMALSRTTIRTTALRGHSPAEALVCANRYIRQDSTSDMFLTAFYGVLDTDNGRFRFANGGHNRPLWWRATRQQFQELEAKGIALGVLGDIELEECQVDLEDGDVLILYTDGVTEAVNEQYEEFGVARLQTAVASALDLNPDIRASELVDVILEAVRAFTGSQPPFDDITLFIIKRAANEAQ